MSLHIIRNIIFFAVMFVGKTKCGSHITLLRVYKGTGVSFLDLWSCHGYSSSDFQIYRSGLVDLNFTKSCPTHVNVGFRTNSPEVHLSYGNLLSNSIMDWIMSPTYFRGGDLPITNIAQNEDVIFKGYKKSESRQNLYFAVYYPKCSSKCYPKYFVTNSSEPIFGNIPGDENLFEETNYLYINGYYDAACNTTHKSTLISSEEMKRTCLQKDNKIDTCDTTRKQETLYKQSDLEHPTIAKAVSSWNTTVHSLIMCAMKCSQEKRICESFFYTPETGNCVGLKHIENALDMPSKAIHYIPANNNCN